MSALVYNDIKKHLPRVKFFESLPIFVYDSTDSTNERAKSYKDMGGEGSAVFIADTQTKGRGRRGRSFVSESGRGLYMSLLAYPDIKPEDIAQITAYTAVITVEAISTLTGLTPKIKWVNDLYVGKRKLAGILTEGVFGKDGRLSGVIVGIGINIFGTSFPPEIESIATSLELEGRAVDRAALAAKITELFYSRIEYVGAKEIADRYRELSFLVGSHITVHKPTCSYGAYVEGITDKCELSLVRDDGEREILSTGEVSVRENSI